MDAALKPWDRAMAPENVELPADTVSPPADTVSSLAAVTRPATDTCHGATASQCHSVTEETEDTTIQSPD